MGYAFLPPIQRTLATPLEPVSHPLTFPHQLPAWRNPSFSEPRMTHLVSRDAPSGVIAADDRGGGVPGSWVGGSAELTLLPPPAPKQVQRTVRTSLTSVPAAAPSLPVVHRRTVAEDGPLPEPAAAAAESATEPVGEAPEPPAEPDEPAPPQTAPAGRVRPLEPPTSAAVQRAVSSVSAPEPTPAPVASPARRPRMALGGPLPQVPPTAAETAAGRTLGSVQRHRTDTGSRTAATHESAPSESAPTGTAPMLTEPQDQAAPTADRPSPTQRPSQRSSAAKTAPMPLAPQPAAVDGHSGQGTAPEVPAEVPGEGSAVVPGEVSAEVPSEVVPVSAGQAEPAADGVIAVEASAATVPAGQSEPTAPLTMQRSLETVQPAQPAMEEKALLSDQPAPASAIAPDGPVTPSASRPEVQTVDPALVLLPPAPGLPSDSSNLGPSAAPETSSSGPAGPGPAPSARFVAADGGGATLLRTAVGSADRPARAGGPETAATPAAQHVLQRTPDALDLGHHGSRAVPHRSQTSVALLDPAEPVGQPVPGDVAPQLVLPAIQRAVDRAGSSRETGLFGTTDATTGLLQVDPTTPGAAPGPGPASTTSIGPASPAGSPVGVQRSLVGTAVRRAPDAPAARPARAAAGATARPAGAAAGATARPALAAAQATARLAVQRSLQRTVTEATPEAVQRSIVIDEVDTTLGDDPGGNPPQGGAPATQTFSAQAPSPNAGAEGRSREDVEELAEQLIEPLLRRIRQQLLRDRERLGRRQDRWW